MRIVYCRFFPSKGYLAIKLLGIWFVRKGIKEEATVREILEDEELYIEEAKKFNIRFLSYLKKLLVCLCLATVVVSLNSCTENVRTRRLSMDMTIELPVGEKLIMATWKEDDLFYLTEPMDSGYIPKTKTFREKSSFGILESKVIFRERRK